jgi:hypothetical protein
MLASVLLGAATGLPKAGDVLGGERFSDDASLSFVFVVPLAPLAP